MFGGNASTGVEKERREAVLQGVRSESLDPLGSVLEPKRTLWVTLSESLDHAYNT